MSYDGAELIVKCLEKHNVKYVFSIPGAKIDAILEALRTSSIKLILCRHEQNAAFMAAAYGRMTEKPGVVLVTSGPGVANLATGLLTATTEGDPIVAIGGNVSLAMKLKESHQNTNNVALMKPITKSSVEILSVEAIPEVFANAFRISKAPRSGACFISIPQDISLQSTNIQPIESLPDINYGQANLKIIRDVCQAIQRAKFPIILLGQETSRDINAQAVRALLKNFKFPVIGTYQAAGVIPTSLLECFYGRVGLFKNQPGDILIDQADLIISIGFNPVEYDPETWQSLNNRKKIIHISYTPADIRNMYQPKFELLGDIHENINLIEQFLNRKNFPVDEQARQEFEKNINLGNDKIGKENTIHPLRFIYELHKAIDEQKTIITCDVGSIYMWMARYFLCHNPHHLLFSNGQQTLGVALPWAIGVKLAKKDKKIISLSGDGGFLFSATELETAVREKINFIHFVWNDGSYNMVKEQQILKYNHDYAVSLGYVDVVKFADSFGAKGYRVKQPEDIKVIIKKAQKQQCPVLVEVPIDYSDNEELFITTDLSMGN